MFEFIDDHTPPEYVRPITLYDEMSHVLEKVAAAANAVFDPGPVDGIYWNKDQRGGSSFRCAGPWS